MLLIYKENIALRVHYGAGTLWIRPLPCRSDHTPLLTALARNEEVLAQAHLIQHPTDDEHSVLMGYFEKRGWLVKEADN